MSNFTDQILNLLQPIGTIQTRKKFGGTLLIVDNKQIGLIVKDTFYLKVKEPELQKKYIEMGSQQLQYIDKETEELAVTKIWWSVPEEVIESKGELVGLAYEVLLQGT